MKKYLLALAPAAFAFFSLSATAAPAQILVPGSQTNDFGILCKEGQAINFEVDKRKSNNYRVARNIVFTEMGGGRVAISMLHGSTYADEEATYLSGVNEHCETYRQ